MRNIFLSRSQKSSKDNLKFKVPSVLMTAVQYEFDANSQHLLLQLTIEVCSFDLLRHHKERVQNQSHSYSLHLVYVMKRLTTEISSD